MRCQHRVRTPPLQDRQSTCQIGSVVQACAQRILGERAMDFSAKTFNDPICKDACAEAGVFEKKWYWKHSNGYKQWFLDGLTIDPTKVLEGKTVLWDSSGGKGNLPVHESCAVNASPGDLPQLHAMLATHAEFGTVLFLPALSCTGGPVGAWDDVDIWTCQLTEEERKFLIHDMQYYVMPKALDHNKRDKEAVEAHRKAVADEMLSNINKRLFLVCPLYIMCCSTCCRTECITHCSHPATDLGPPSSLGTSSGAQTTRIGPAQRGVASALCCSSSSFQASIFLTSRCFCIGQVTCSEPPCTSTASNLLFNWKTRST